MTPRELAEKIVQFTKEFPYNVNPEMVIESLLTKALAEAELKSELETIQQCKSVDEAVVKEARAAAYEECAKIAEDCFVNAYHHSGYADDGTELIEPSSLEIAGDEISKMIRLRAGEMK